MNANRGDGVPPSQPRSEGSQAHSGERQPGSARSDSPHSGSPQGSTALLERPELQDALAAQWDVVVWNDPVNLMDYVAYVFRSYFGHSAARADQLMLQVHEQGRAVVSTGSREQSEKHTQAMHEYGLQATLERSL